MTWKYIQLLIKDKNTAKGSKSTIERYYSFVEASAAQEAKVKLSLGLVNLIAERKPSYLVLKGDLIRDPPTFGYSNLAIILKAEGQRYDIDIGSHAEKKEKPEQKNSELKLGISSDLPISGTSMGRLFPSYLRTFEDGLIHYRQYELNALAKLLGGLEHPVFGLQREFGMNADQALEAVDEGATLEKLASELIEQKKRK